MLNPASQFNLTQAQTDLNNSFLAKQEEPRSAAELNLIGIINKALNFLKNQPPKKFLSLISNGRSPRKQECIEAIENLLSLHESVGQNTELAPNKPSTELAKETRDALLAIFSDIKKYKLIPEKQQKQFLLLEQQLKQVIETSIEKQKDYAYSYRKYLFIDSIPSSFESESNPLAKPFLDRVLDSPRIITHHRSSNLADLLKANIPYEELTSTEQDSYSHFFSEIKDKYKELANKFPNINRVGRQNILILEDHDFHSLVTEKKLVAGIALLDSGYIVVPRSRIDALPHEAIHLFQGLAQNINFVEQTDTVKTGMAISRSSAINGQFGAPVLSGNILQEIHTDDSSKNKTGYQNQKTVLRTILRQAYLTEARRNNQAQVSLRDFNKHYEDALKKFDDFAYDTANYDLETFIKNTFPYIHSSDRSLLISLDTSLNTLNNNTLSILGSRLPIIYSRLALKLNYEQMQKILLSEERESQIADDTKFEIIPDPEAFLIEKRIIKEPLNLVKSKNNFIQLLQEAKSDHFFFEKFIPIDINKDIYLLSPKDYKTFLMNKAVCPQNPLFKESYYDFSRDNKNKIILGLPETRSTEDFNEAILNAIYVKELGGNSSLDSDTEKTKLKQAFLNFMLSHIIPEEEKISNQQSLSNSIIRAISKSDENLATEEEANKNLKLLIQGLFFQQANFYITSKGGEERTVFTDLLDSLSCQNRLNNTAMKDLLAKCPEEYPKFTEL